MREATSSGCCRCAAWPASATIAAPAFGAVAAILLRRARVALVAAARDREHGELEREQLVPDRLEHALPGGAQQVGELDGVLREAPGPLGLDQRLGLVGEQRLALPDGNDVLDRRRLDPGRKPVVGLGAGGPCRRVLDSGGGADGDQAGVASRVAQRGAQRQPAAERVADQQRTLPGRGDLRQAALEGVLAVVEQGGRRVELLGHRRPRRSRAA